MHLPIQSRTIFAVIVNGSKRSDFNVLFEGDFPFDAFFIGFQFPAFDFQRDLLSPGGQLSDVGACNFI
ncbi:MAG: hypothetical protein ACOVRM_11020 [Planctomycetaceae bacterium]